MALIKCKHCGNLISDKALRCPKCGNPVSSQDQNINETETTVEPINADSPLPDTESAIVPQKHPTLSDSSTPKTDNITISKRSILYAALAAILFIALIISITFNIAYKRTLSESNDSQLESRSATTLNDVNEIPANNLTTTESSNEFAEDNNTESQTKTTPTESQTSEPEDNPTEEATFELLSVPTNNDISVSLSDIKEGNAYTYLYFLVKNNTNTDIQLVKDWVYINDTTVERVLDHGRYTVEANKGVVLEYVFDSSKYFAAKGDNINKLEVGFRINESEDAFFYTLTPATDDLTTLVSQIASYQDEQPVISSSNNISITVNEIKEGNGYTYLTFTVKNLTNNKIDLSTGWVDFNGISIPFELKHGSFSIDAGRSTVLEYVFSSSRYFPAKGNELKTITIRLFVNDSEENEIFNLKYEGE